MEVEYCPACGMPPEYCEFGPKDKFARECRPFIEKRFPHLLGGSAAAPAAGAGAGAGADADAALSARLGGLSVAGGRSAASAST